MTAYEKLKKRLRAKPKTWLVTGAAGFIGSHLTRELLALNQRVIGLDNFSTGHKRNLAAVRKELNEESWTRFRFIRGDIRDLSTCKRACANVDFVLHEAALGSVPRSVEDPISSNECNVTGFLNMLVAARDAKVKRFIYASSSAVYGDEQGLPKTEGKIGRALSPYGVTKHVNELYARVFAECYQFQSIGLRYFNVYGPRQDPNGPYAAVIPKWVEAMVKGSEILIFGDGETSRDFCYVENVVQANLLAATVGRARIKGDIYNVACSERTTLNELFAVLREALLPFYPHLLRQKPHYRPFRAGDVRHSLADIDAAKRELGYEVEQRFSDGIKLTVAHWHASGNH